jgi:fructoselysine-6-P-deglycase FrlB-like protein
LSSRSSTSRTQRSRAPRAVRSRCARVAETGIAATKSFIATLAAIAQLVGSWMQDAELLDALDAAPDELTRAWALDWSAAIEPLRLATTCSSSRAGSASASPRRRRSS